MDLRLNILSLISVYAICFIAWLFSRDRRNIPYETIKWTLGAQFILVFLNIIFPGVMQIFENIFHFFVSLYLLFITEQEIISDSSALILGDILIRSINITLFLSIAFFYFSKSDFYQRILKVLRKITRSTLRIDSDEFIISISSSVLSFEAIFLSPNLHSYSSSRIFTVLSILAATPTSVLLWKEYSHIKSVSQSFLGHLYLASILSVFSTIALSKILVPQENEEKEQELEKKSSTNLYSVVELIIKFFIGLIVGGFFLQIILHFVGNLFGSLVFSGDLRVIPEDSWTQVVTKFFKSGLTEAFTRLTIKNILAFFLLPLCFISGISFEIIEIWKVALLCSNSFFGQTYELGIPVLLKEGNLSIRTSFFIIYLLVGGNSLIKVGMIWGGLLAILPEKIASMSYLFPRLLLVSILSPFLSVSILGIFEFSQLHF